MARPPIYNSEEHPKIARQVMGEGKTFRALAQILDVCIDTVNDWRERHPEFSAAIRMGKEDADLEVERCLFARATGYTWDSEKIVVADGEVVRVPIKEHAPPDVAAQRFWLSNRMAKQWREADRQAAAEAAASIKQAVLVEGLTITPQEPKV